MSGSGSTTRHTIEVFYQVTGADKTASTFTSVNKAVDNNTRLLSQNYNAANKTAIGTRDLAIAQKVADTSIRNTDGTLNKFANTSEKSTGVTKKFADAIRGNKGLAFGMVGLLTSGVEAISMLSMWNDMDKNLSEAQAQLNELVEAGITSGSAYTRAVNLVNDAQRGLNFTQRNLILSFFDLVPFLLLTTTGLMNVAKHSGGAKNALSKLGSTVGGLISNIGKSKTPLNDLNTSIGVTFPASAQRAGKSMGSFITPIGVEFPKSVGKAGGASSMFTGLLGKLGSGFKAAGLAALGFGRALAGALILNPIGLAITAVSVALGVLMFDLGGVRTKLKELGQAWGEQVPILKPVIDHYIKAGDNLGYIGQRLIEFVTSAKSSTDGLISTFKDLGANITSFGGAARIAFLTAKGFNDAQAEAVQIFGAVNKVLGGEIEAFDNLDNALQKSAEYVLGVISTHEELGKITTKTIENLIKNREAAEAFGDSVRYATDGNIDYAKSFKAMEIAQNEFGRDIAKWGTLVESEMKKGVTSVQTFENQFNILKELYPEFADIAEREHQRVINAILENKDKYPEQAAELEKLGYKYEQVIENNVLASYEKWEAKQRMIMDVHGTMTDSVLADKELVAQKVAELEQKYLKFGITAEDIWKEIETLLNQNVTTTKDWIKEQEDAAKEFAKAWDDAVGQVKDRFNDLGGSMRSSASDLGEILNTKKKDRSKEDKKRLKGLDLSGDEKDELKWIDDMEKRLTEFSDFLTVGRPAQAAQVFRDMYDEAPAKYAGNFDQINAILDKAGLTSAGMSEIFGQSMGDMDANARAAITAITAQFGTDPFKTFQVGVHQTDMATAKLAATLGGKVNEALKGLSDGAVVGKAEWDKFYGSLDSSQKQLPALQDVLKGIELGMYNNADGTVNWGRVLQAVGGIAQQAGEQVGHVTKSLSDMNTVTLDSGETFAQLGNQWVSVGDNFKTTADGKIVPAIEGVNTKVGEVAPTAETGLAPVEGIFSAAFLKASIAATGQMSLILADITLSMQYLRENIGKELDAVTLKFDGLAVPLQNTNDKIKLLDTNTKTYMENIRKSVDTMRLEVTTDLKSVDAGYLKTQEASSKLSTSVKAHTDSMEKNIADWASKMTSAFNKVISEANKVVSAMNKIKAAINAIPSTKTITIKYKTVGKPSGGAQHGGAFITDHQEDIGGVKIGEFSKPELVTVTPLSNSHDISDKSINMDIGSSLNPLKKQMTRGIQDMVSNSGVSAGSQGPGMPSTITVTLVMPNGEVLLRQIQPFLLRNYSSIT